jgi:hypothetical protein
VSTKGARVARVLIFHGVCVRFHAGARKPFAERVPPQPLQGLTPGPDTKGRKGPTKGREVPTRGLLLYTSRGVDACVRSVDCVRKCIVCRDVAPTSARL